MDHSSSFEAQLRASPIINDILDRLDRCERSNQEIQRDLGDVHRKVDLLVDRSLGVNAQPEFKDPFASSNLGVPGLGGPRRSVSGGLAPNQAPDDITQISQRLNTLTSSVGQLLALQTQQHIQNATSALGNNQMAGLLSQQLDVPPNPMHPAHLPGATGLLGHGLPNRGAPRVSHPPMRTWSAGSLDFPGRPSDGGVPPVGRTDGLRDKRRSSTALRRDSSSVRYLHFL